MTKKQMIEWMKTPGFAGAVDALRFLARRAHSRARCEGSERYADMHRKLEFAANALIIEHRDAVGPAPRKYGTVKPC